MNGCSRNSYSAMEKIVPVPVLLCRTIIYWCSPVVYELLHQIGSVLYYKLRLVKDFLIH